MMVGVESRQSQSPVNRVDPTAVVEDGARIGPGVAIWHHCHVRSSAVVGAGTVLGKNVYVDTGVTVGDRVRVQNNVSLYRGVTVEDDCFVGPSVVFTNDLVPRSRNSDWQPVSTFVRRGASIGANATIVCGVTIGEWSLVAAGTVVTADVRPHEIVAGNPGRTLGWVCECGASRVRAKGERLSCSACLTELDPGG